MKSVIFKILLFSQVLLYSGCDENSGKTDSLEGTVWVRTWVLESDYFNRTINYKNTLKFKASTYSKECYSDYAGVYASHSGVYDVSDYPEIVMCDTNGHISIGTVNGNQLKIGNKIYNKK